jgi:hypothetical protein
MTGSLQESRMTNLAVTDDLFFARTGMDPNRVENLVGELLHGMDDGELFLEYSQSESVALVRHHAGLRLARDR